MKSASRSIGTSRGCQQCRSKRKKCDLMNPCGRCMKSHSICSGPIEGALFINRHKAGFTRQSQRNVLQDALTKHHQSNKTSLGAVLQKTQGDRALKGVTTVSDTVSNRETIKFLYASLLKDFCDTSFATGEKQDAVTNIFNHSAIALCLRNVVRLGSASQQRPQMLDLGVFSLLSLYFGKAQTQHYQLIELARRSYNLAVQALFRALSDLKSNTEDKYAHQKLLAQNSFNLSLVLILFELVDTRTASSALDIHIDGALSILRQMGPSKFEQSTHQRQLLSGFRGIAYASSARRRLSLFLDEPQWLNVFRDGEEENNLERLYDIAVHLPRILAETRKLVSTEAAASFDKNLKLLADYEVLKSMFQSWYLQQLAPKEALLTSKKGAHHMEFGKSEAGLKETPHLTTMLIELEMGFSDLLSSFPRNSNFAHVPHQYRNWQTMDTQKLLERLVKSVQSLSSSLEGQLVAAIPSETLNRYLERRCP